MSPIFSIVIPTFNRSKEITRAIDSVLSQSFSNFELLIVDDGSTDNTFEIVSAYRDPRLFYLYSENFGGSARPRNLGISRATGEWICMLDSDDWWTKDKLKVCAKFIGKDTDFLYHDLSIVRDSPAYFKRRKLRSRQLRKPIFSDLLVSGNIIPNSSVVVRKTLLDLAGGISENLKLNGSEDYNAWLRIATFTDKFAHIPKSLGFYMIHSNNITNKNNFDNWIESIGDFHSLIPPRQRRLIYGNASYLSGRYKSAHSMFPDAISDLYVALKQSSPHIRVRAAVAILCVLIRSIFSKLNKNA